MKHLGLSLALVCLALPATAQVTFDPDPFRDLPPAAAATDDPLAPRLRVELDRSVELPGPLPGTGAGFDGTELVVPLERGLARVDPAHATATIDRDAGPLVVDDDWIVAGDGEFRARFVGSSGKLVVQRRCARCRDGWRRAWRLRLPGGAGLAPPTFAGRRIYVGTMDNRIHALRRHNGHRGWTVDVGGRVSRRLAVAGDERPVVLAIPDDGARLIVLDALDGSRQAGILLDEDDGEFVGAPLPLPDGRVAVLRQRYRRSEAAVEIYRLVPVAASGPESDPPRNHGESAPAARLRYTDPRSSYGAAGP